jgi:hypothetical protein
MSLYTDSRKLIHVPLKIVFGIRRQFILVLSILRRYIAGRNVKGKLFGGEDHRRKLIIMFQNFLIISISIGIASMDKCSAD